MKGCEKTLWVDVWCARAGVSMYCIWWREREILCDYDHDSRWQSDDDNADESMKLWKKTMDCSKSSNIWSSELQQHFKSDIYECSLKLAD